jgi:DNA invertase Pin-like site-specific DNA recombinase
MPQADAFQLHIYAALAEQERVFIAARTKAGLERAVAAGKLLGHHHPKVAAATAQRSEKAQQQAEQLRSLVVPMRAQGMAMAAIASALTASGIPTPSGKGEWSVMGVKRVLERLELPCKLGA